MNRIVIALLKPFSFIPAILMMSLIFSFSFQNETESSQLSEKSGARHFHHDRPRHGPRMG